MLSRHESSIDFCNMKEGVGINEATRKEQERASGRCREGSRGCLPSVQSPQGFLWVQNCVSMGVTQSKMRKKNQGLSL